MIKVWFGGSIAFTPVSMVSPWVKEHRDALIRLVADIRRTWRRHLHGFAQPPYPQLAGAPFSSRGPRGFDLDARVARSWPEPRWCAPRTCGLRNPFLDGWNGSRRRQALRCDRRLGRSATVDACTRAYRNGGW